MNRINLSVDLESTELLTQEIENIISGAAKQKTREFFNNILGKEIDRLVIARLKDWTEEDKSFFSNTKTMHKMLIDKIDEEVKKSILTIKVNEEALNNRIDSIINTIDDDIKRHIAIKLDAVDYATKITSIIQKEVQKQIPLVIFNLLKQKSEPNNLG